MIYVIHCLDKPGHLSKRMAFIDEHRARLATKPITVLSSGPLLSDDGRDMIGSLFLVDAKDRGEAEAFLEGDPFTEAGIWESVSVHRYGARTGALSDYQPAPAT